MTELDKIIKQLCKREEEAGCYDYKIDGISLYNLIRFKARNTYLQANGYNFVEKYSGGSLYQTVKSILISGFQLLKIRVMKKQYDSLFYPFLRLDNVDGLYLDKFTDPIIDCCGLDNFIIFERGRRGLHLKPRVHQNCVVYTNWIDIKAELTTKFTRRQFEKKHRDVLNMLFKSLDYVLEGKAYDRVFLLNRLIYNMSIQKSYTKLFHMMGIKKVFAPSRVNIVCQINAARKNSIKVFEFQHGITYGETALYSGYRDPEYTPDGFLAFGDTPPRNVYGIDESKIYNIGWAFQDYLDKIVTDDNVAEKDVLVISGPCLTEKILDATIRLATLFPTIQFVVRPHPAEVVTDAHRELASKYANISWQDPKVNVAVAMKQYSHLIGENSTVLYEALTYGKKVARICFDGFAPRYLTPEDEECFWKISDKASFEAFINGKVKDKKSMKIYTKFDKELFMNLYNA